MVEPPSVAPAIESMEDEDAVWKESMDIADSCAVRVSSAGGGVAS